MDFEWDPDKARKNEAKHGVSFTEASEVFGDILSSTALDPDNSDTEERFVIFGKSTKNRHLVVSFTERDARIRIISARMMKRREIAAYEQ